MARMHPQFVRLNNCHLHVADVTFKTCTYWSVQLSSNNAASASIATGCVATSHDVFTDVVTRLLMSPAYCVPDCLLLTYNIKACRVSCWV